MQGWESEWGGVGWGGQDKPRGGAREGLGGRYEPRGGGWRGVSKKYDPIANKLFWGVFQIMLDFI